MAKSFINVVQNSSRTSLCIPVKIKNPLSRTMLPLAGPPFGFKLYERQPGAPGVRGRGCRPQCDF